MTSTLTSAPDPNIIQHVAAPFGDVCQALINATTNQLVGIGCWGGGTVRGEIILVSLCVCVSGCGQY